MDNSSWLSTFVYASPQPVTRLLLWEGLRSVASLVNEAWMIMGDFNAMLLDSEKRSRTSNNGGSCQHFQDLVFDLGLKDAGFSGPQFTWQRGGTFERLDRVIYNDIWENTFPDSNVTHLHRLKLDHRPLLLLNQRKLDGNHQRPFRFMSCWLRHEGFKKLVSENWTMDVPIESSMPRLIQAMERWNKDVFGDIIARKRNLIARIRGVQAKLDVSGDYKYRKLDEKLRLELEKVLEDEESMWKQKSCSEWLGKRDCNTRYYHNCVIQRRRRNRISGLKIQGSWCFDEAELNLAAVEYFKHLYQVEGFVTDQFPISGQFPPLENRDLACMTVVVTKEEVKAALSDMPPLKALGADGCHAQLFQSQWNVMGDSVYEFIHRIFSGGNITSDMNNTSLVLLPKVANPELLTQFRPIGLCKVLYKILSTTVVNRLHNVMPKLVAENQVSFIKGRCITDNTLIAQEVIHSMRVNKGKKKWMAVKVDLEKAYDRLRWDFLHETLTDAGLPDSLIEVIMKCVTSASLNVMWNGKLSEPFLPSKGIRQGDPLSPYLFVLAMEKLGQMIRNECNKGRWMPILLKKRCPPISHLFFADDLLLFCEADVEQARMLTRVLSTYCEHSGHKVSVNKMQVYFSKNVSEESAAAIAQCMGFQRVNDLGLYLGIPLFHSRVTSATYEFVVDKVRRKLNGWDARSLSRAGRLTLAKSVLMAIPSYFLQTALIPISVCLEIEKLVRHFVWGTVDGQRNKSLINWDEVCMPKERGGLGLHKLHQQNRAFMMKIGFNIIANQQALWARIFRTKYNITEECPLSIKHSEASYVWRSFMLIWEEVRRGVYWHIRDGRKTTFWTDTWLPKVGALWDKSLPNAIIDTDVRVTDMVNHNGQWNWDLIQSLVDKSVLPDIAGICP